VKNRAIHFFGGVSMTNGHDGLAEIAEKHKVVLDDLRPGEFACFVNKTFTAMKLMCAEGVLIHWRNPSHRALFSEVIETLPQFLADADIGFSQEVKQAIAKYYKRYLGKTIRIRRLSAVDGAA
jgi:hypothetical protein